MSGQQSQGNRCDAYYRHVAAYNRPRAGFEAALVGMIDAVEEYARAHAETFESDVSDDGVLGASLAGAIFAIRGLLDGELGRLDGGYLWDRLTQVAKAAGWRDLDHVAKDAR